MTGVVPKEVQECSKLIEERMKTVTVTHEDVETAMRLKRENPNECAESVEWIARVMAAVRDMEKTIFNPDNMAVTNPMSADHQDEDARYRLLREETIKIQPDLPKLERILLKIGGERLGLLLEPQVDSDIPLLIDYGFVMRGPVIRITKNMEPHACHANVATLWKAKNRKIVSVGTGYALVGNIWGQHSWGITQDGSIVETTRCDRVVYFGFICGWLLGDQFAQKQGVGR